MNRHERRALEAALRASGLAAVEKLTVEAHRRAVSLMERQGTVLSPEHSEALFHLVGCMAMLAYRKKVGRYAFDLSTGAGKTTSIVAFVSALHALSLPHSVAVASEKVEGLCQLYRDLQAEGVPAAEIGLWHSYSHDPEQADRIKRGEAARPGYASEPRTTDKASELPRYRYLLYTHAKITGSKTNAPDFTVHEERPAGPSARGQASEPRSLVVWDEAMMSSRHASLHWVAFERQLGGLLRMVDMWPARYEHLRPIVDYLVAASDLLKAEWRRQEEDLKLTGTTSPRVISLPATADVDTSALDMLKEDAVDNLTALLTEAHRPLRIVHAAQGVITFDIVIPPVLDNVAILDASAPIRKLMQADASIKRWPGFDGRIVDYSDVAIHYAKHGAGRSTVEKDIHKGDRQILREVVKVAQQIPTDEAILFFTFKTKDAKHDTVALLKRSLQEAGIDTEASVTFRGQQRPRIVVLTWGQETSLSHFQYCRNVILCGVLERSNWDVAGAIAGQRGDLKAIISGDTLEEIKLSEASHVVYQALSRGSARIVVNGKASPMRAWLFHRNPLALKAALTDGPDAVMPGAQWFAWSTEHMEQDEAKIREAAASLRRVLDGLPPDARDLSIREWKKRAGVTLEARSFQLARDAALDGTAWAVAGQRIVRHFTPADAEAASEDIITT